ncbi:hypothetical protein PAQ31011_00271 [Pandoraea aquatica]|uniref:Uncharacterized protein n=1 Tax=Pandoraea aquatica TaxID=2508290 RepID=A0A5E4RMA2_9BURK|nr:hypothetical protein [Pandoraea aquatica]VVD64490.1 hypothetical protein PAQ31011_00271 [Pandoraea aquatica]
MTETDVLAIEQRATALVHAQVLGMLLAHINHLDATPAPAFDCFRQAAMDEIRQSLVKRCGMSGPAYDELERLFAALARASDDVFTVADHHNARFFRQLRERKVTEEPALD